MKKNIIILALVSFAIAFVTSYFTARCLYQKEIAEYQEKMKEIAEYQQKTDFLCGRYLRQLCHQHPDIKNVEIDGDKVVISFMQQYVSIDGKSFKEMNKVEEGILLAIKDVEEGKFDYGRTIIRLCKSNCTLSEASGSAESL